MCSGNQDVSNNNNIEGIQSGRHSSFTANLEALGVSSVYTAGEALLLPARTS